jgi:TRAP-type C4-dicarboxylate transport system permease small subunit
MKPMSRILDGFFSFLTVIIGIILVLMTLSIGYAIFARAVNLPGPVWIVQFNEYAMLFATFLGAAWLLARGKHVSIEMVVSHLSRRSQRILGLIHSLLGMGLCAILCWYGTFTTIENFQRNVIHVQAVDVPMAYILFVIPLGFFLLFLQFARGLVEGARKFREDSGREGQLKAAMNPVAPETGKRRVEGGGR